MGKIVLVTGGARSGKSAFAEELVNQFGNRVVYIATSIPFDEEMRSRIEKHRDRRPSHWETVEVYKGLEKVLSSKSSHTEAFMLDCITVMITNLMFDVCSDWENITGDELQLVEQNVTSEIKEIIRAGKRIEVPLVLVTNEIGMGIVPEHKSARVFRDIAGRANQILAKSADEVYFCVSGIPVRIK